MDVVLDRDDQTRVIRTRVWGRHNFRMELTYLNKLKARKVALEEYEGTLIQDHNDPEDKQWRDENKELFMALNDNRENDEASDVKTGESDKKSDLFREQGLGILRAIYSGTIDALPSSFSLRTRFMEILLATELAHSEEMQEILADMKIDFSIDLEYWDWLARVGTVGLHSTQEMNKEIMLDQRVTESNSDMLPCQLLLFIGVTTIFSILDVYSIIL